MTNHEKYQRAFSTLHPSQQWNMEGTEMKQTRKRYLPRAAVVCAAVILVLALAATAYAADIGEKGDGLGLYVAWSNLEQEAESAPYAFSAAENGQTVLTLIADDGAISWVKQD